MRILYLEDDEQIRRAMEIVLTRKGHEVLGVGRIDKFKEAAKEFNPDLVVTDLMLPDGDKYKYTNTLLAVVSCIDRARVPVIVYSGAPVDTDECLDLGATECLVKGDVTPLQVPAYFETVINRFKLLNALNTRAVPPLPSSNPFDRVPITAGGVGEEMSSLALELRDLAEDG